MYDFNIYVRHSQPCFRELKLTKCAKIRKQREVCVGLNVYSFTVPNRIVSA